MGKEKTSSYSRICLDFENCPVVKCVFLVNHEQMPAVSDVVACIEKRHNLRSFCKKGNSKYISLWLNNYLIPKDESSRLLSHDDIISIRIQKTNQRDTVFVSDCCESKTTRKKKKELKRKHTESDDAHADILKKAKEALLCKVNTFIALETPNDDKPQKLEVTAQDSSQGKTSEITKDHQSSNGSEVEEREREADNTSNTAPAKGKRKRIRKRRRKKDEDVYKNVSHLLTASDMNVTNDNTPAKSRDMVAPVTSKEVCFGSFPDKLQNPKHYRQGFRKAVVCKPEPSEHIRFGSDAEDEVTQVVEQYEYLNHKALEQKQMKSPRRTEERMNCEDEFIQNDSLQTQGAQLGGNGIPDRCFQESYKETQSRTFDQDNSMDDGSQSGQLVNDGGSSLSRKVLSNGVTVFSRSRRGQPGRTVPPQSVEQIGMRDQNYPLSSTPVSSSQLQSQGAQEPEYKSKDLTLHQQTPPDITCSPVTSQQQQNGTSSIPTKTADYSKCPPLITLPKPGDKIVYKVLEMSVDCCPEVSDYKEALVLSVDKNQMIQMKNCSRQEIKYNKFHLEVEADNEVWTNIAENPETVTLHHSSLLEPKILV